MIDFSGLPTRKKAYAGANGSKIAVIYNGEQYMLKFPTPPPRNKAMSNTNGCASEYIGCHIFESVGIPVQETLLGIYQKDGKEKVVVACKDFTAPGIVLQDFASFSIPLSGIRIDGAKVNYFDFVSSLENEGCNLALKRIHPRINMRTIFGIVDNTPYISDLQKSFYKTMLTERKERILDYSMRKLQKRERGRSAKKNG